LHRKTNDLQQPQASPFALSAFSFELSCFELQLHSIFSFDLSPLTFYSFHASPSHLLTFPTSQLLYPCVSACPTCPVKCALLLIRRLFNRDEMFFIFYFIGVANMFFELSCFELPLLSPFTFQL